MQFWAASTESSGQWDREAIGTSLYGSGESTPGILYSVLGTRSWARCWKMGAQRKARKKKVAEEIGERNAKS